MLHSILHTKQWKGKRVFVRVDFNVPVRRGRVVDAYKIERSLPTIAYLRQHGARIIVASHLGRPKKPSRDLSLRPVQRYLASALKTPVRFFDFTAAWPKRLVALSERLAPGEVVLLENIRFLPGEEKNDQRLIQTFAKAADCFVLDGFAVTHRQTATVTGLARELPAYAGLLLDEEVRVLTKVSAHPKKPLAVIIGGAKVDTKIPIIKRFLPQAEAILLGGAVATTLLYAKGYPVGASLVAPELKSMLLKTAKHANIFSPVDVVVGDEKGKHARVVTLPELKKLKGKNWAIYDIGPKTMQEYARLLKKAQTLVWNGAMGMFEQPPYHYATRALAHLFAARSKGKAFGVAGGGETVEILRKEGLLSEIDLVSTGGGAMLEFLGGVSLPALRAIGYTT